MEGMKFGRTRRSEKAVPSIRTEAHDAGESAFEGAKTDGPLKRGEIGREGKNRDAIFVTGIDGDDKKNCGACERRGNGLRDGYGGCRCLGAERVGRHSNITCLAARKSPFEKSTCPEDNEWKRQLTKGWRVTSTLMRSGAEENFRFNVPPHSGDPGVGLALSGIRRAEL